MLNNPTETVAKVICKRENYVFISYVQSGAFKDTYHIQDSIGSQLALKIYKSDLRSERENREIDAMQMCVHPNVAKFHSLQTISHADKDHMYIIEEFIGGGTLTDKIKKNEINLSTIASIGTQLIDAVAHIASNNLVHRDIKPDNILFREKTITPVIVDFGLVRNLADTSLTPSWIPQGPGTPLYASPEQLNNEKLQQDWRTDQFSLGVTLSYCCFGKHPYDYGQGDYDAVDRVANRKLPSPDFVKFIEENKFPVLQKMIAAWPVSRYQNASDLRKDWNEQTKDF